MSKGSLCKCRASNTADRWARFRKGMGAQQRCAVVPGARTSDMRATPETTGSAGYVAMAIRVAICFGNLHSAEGHDLATSSLPGTRSRDKGLVGCSEGAAARFADPRMVRLLVASRQGPPWWNWAATAVHRCRSSAKERCRGACGSKRRVIILLVGAGTPASPIASRPALLPLSR